MPERDAGDEPEGVAFGPSHDATEDDEPSLGSLHGTAEGAHLGQGGWAKGGVRDFEEDAADMPQGDDDFEHDGRDLPTTLRRYGAL